MDLGLSGQVALITGGSRGIGRATAMSLAKEGCRVGICARGEERLNSALEELRSIGPDVWGTVSDVTDRADTERFVSDASERLGGVDALVCNVGGSSGGSTLEATDEEWHHTLDVNLMHSVRTIRAAVPRMKEAGKGAIVIVSSISGWKPGPRGQYGAAKAAEIFLSGVLARELAPYNIRVNTVCPGSILFQGGGWARFKEQNPKEFERWMEKDLPWNRLGTDQEVADVIAFLLSERSRWINGAMIPVDGSQGRPVARWFGDDTW